MFLAFFINLFDNVDLFRKNRHFSGTSVLKISTKLLDLLLIW